MDPSVAAQAFFDGDESSSSAIENPASKTVSDPLLIDDLKHILNSLSINSPSAELLSYLSAFCHSQCQSILSLSRDFALHAGRSVLSPEDIELATQQINLMTCEPPTRETLAQLARKVNSRPMPIVPQRAGIILPPKRFTLLNENFDVNLESSETLALID